MTNAGRWLIIWIVLIMLLLMGGIICANAEETISDAMTNEEIMECYGLPEKIELHETDLVADIANIEVLDEHFVMESAVPRDGASGLVIKGTFVDDGIEVNVTINISVNEYRLEIGSYQPFEIKDFYFDTSMDVQADFTTDAEEDDKQPTEIELIRIPWFTAYAMQVCTLITGEFKMDGSVDITFKNQGGKCKFAYANGQWNNEYIAGTKSFEINMEGKAEFIIKGGITITPIAGFCDLVRVSVVEKIGMSVSKSFDPMVPQTALCSDVKPYWKVYPEAKIGLIPKAGAKVPAFIGDGKCSITTTGNGIQLLEDKEHHFEGFKRVSECTWRTTTVNFFSEDGVLYATKRIAIDETLSAEKAQRPLIMQGKVFIGWRVTKEDGTLVSESLPVVVGKETLNCTAQWDAVSEKPGYTLPEDDDQGYAERVGKPRISSVNEKEEAYQIVGAEQQGATLYCRLIKPGNPDYQNYTKAYQGSVTSTGPTVQYVVFDDGFYGTSGVCGGKSLIGIQFADSMRHTGNNSRNYRLQWVHLPANMVDSPYFPECYSLQEISIPSGVTSIASSAFDRCYSLKKIEIPDTVQTIGQNAFRHCYSLEEITIPEGVTQIGKLAFGDCTSLRTLHLPSTLTKFDTVLYNNPQLEQLELHVSGDLQFGNANIENLRKVNISGKNIDMTYAIFSKGIETITIQGETIRIPDNVFKEHPNLTSVTLIANEIYLGEYSFADCYALQEVTISQCSKLYLGNSAFLNCKNLEVFSFDGTVYPYRQEGKNQSETYLLNAFDGTAIHQLNLHLNVGRIKITLMPLLENLTLTGSVDTIMSISGNMMLKKIALPSGVKTITAICNNPMLEELQLPSSIQTITQINNNGRLKALVIPENASLADYALSDNPSLETVHLPQSLKMVPIGLLQNCTSLKYVQLPTQLEQIGGKAFYGCASLQNITLPESLLRVDDYVFTNCTALTEMTIPRAVWCFGNDSLTGCTNLKTVYVLSDEAFVFFPDDNFYGERTIYCPRNQATWSVTESTRVAIDAPVYTLRIHYPDGRDDMVKTRTAGDTLVEPRMYSMGIKNSDCIRWFSDAEWTNQITFPSVMPEKNLDIYLGYTYKLWDDFVNWDKLDGNYDWDEYDPATGNWRQVPKLISYNNNQRYFHIPDQFEIMYADAIHEGIRYLEIGASMRQIDPAAFRLAVDLERFYVDPANAHYYAQDGVLYSADGTLIAYPYKKDNQQFTVPDGVTSIGAYAFAIPAGKESPLLQVQLPCSVTSVAENAFAGHERPFAVMTENTSLNAQIDAEGVFCNPAPLVLMSEDNMVSFYLLSAGLPLPELPNPMKDGAYFIGWSLKENDDVADLSALTLPADGMVLYACWSKKVQYQTALPAMLKIIESEAFLNAPMVSVRCPDGLTTIESCAFAGCDQLRDIYLPDSVQYIAEDAFANVPQLTIHTPAGSIAEKWAKKQGITVVPEREEP